LDAILAKTRAGITLFFCTLRRESAKCRRGVKMAAYSSNAVMLGTRRAAAQAAPYLALQLSGRAVKSHLFRARARRGSRRALAVKIGLFGWVAGKGVPCDGGLQGRGGPLGSASWQRQGVEQAACVERAGGLRVRKRKVTDSNTLYI